MVELITHLLNESESLPLMVYANGTDDATPKTLQELIYSNSEWVDERLNKHAALLFRGFGLTTAIEFEQVAQYLTGGLQRYVGGDSPRTPVLNKVYTSTEYPAHWQVELHHELAYGRWWPNRVLFFCKTPPDKDGETPIADGRRIYDCIDPVIRQRFADKGVRYIQNLRDESVDGPGKSWQKTFENDDREYIDNYCCDANMDTQWTEYGLRTQIVRPSVLQHPVTGESVWFNQADQWHAEFTSVKHHDAVDKPDTRQNPPCHATYGDGTEIDPGDLQKIRNAYNTCEVLFPWQQGDVLLLDNILAAHGRKPFIGKREILVAMG